MQFSTKKSLGFVSTPIFVLKCNVQVLFGIPIILFVQSIFHVPVGEEFHDFLLMLTSFNW